MVLCAHVIASDATSTHMLRSRIRACMYIMMMREPYASLICCLPVSLSIPLSPVLVSSHLLIRCVLSRVPCAVIPSHIPTCHADQPALPQTGSSSGLSSGSTLGDSMRSADSAMMGDSSSSTSSVDTCDIDAVARDMLCRVRFSALHSCKILGVVLHTHAAVFNCALSSACSSLILACWLPLLQVWVPAAAAAAVAARAVPPVWTRLTRLLCKHCLDPAGDVTARLTAGIRGFAGGVSQY